MNFVSQMNAFKRVAWDKDKKANTKHQEDEREKFFEIFCNDQNI